MALLPEKDGPTTTLYVSFRYCLWHDNMLL